MISLQTEYQQTMQKKHTMFILCLKFVQTRLFPAFKEDCSTFDVVIEV